MNTAENTHEDKLSTDEAAAEILNGLATSGYSLADKVTITKQLRRLLRSEAEEAQKQLVTLLDSL